MSNVLKWKARVQPAPSSSATAALSEDSARTPTAAELRSYRIWEGIPVGRGGRWGEGQRGRRHRRAGRSQALYLLEAAAAAAVYSVGCDDEVQQGSGLQGEEQKKLTTDCCVHFRV